MKTETEIREMVTRLICEEKRIQKEIDSVPDDQKSKPNSNWGAIRSAQHTIRTLEWVLG